MNFTVHSTADYHRQNLRTLGWETTLCNTIANPQSPCRMTLNIKDSYGNLLFDYLNVLLPFKQILHLLEVGGGYGWLMRDFVLRKPFPKVTMIDISPHLLDQQRHELEGFPGAISFREEDFMDTPPMVLRDVDLAILNENIGDYPTITDLTRDFLVRSPATLSPDLEMVWKFFNRYGFPEPQHPVFHINIGALMALEKLCCAHIPFIFLSEHSCEATVAGPYKELIRVSASDNPECIKLKGHDEFTIQFSHLEKIGRYHDYKIIRGPVADFIPFEMTARLRTIMKSPSPWRDEDEIIRYFIEDLYKYEYLLLSKEQHEPE
jgi:hypothetical protein